MRLFWIGCSVTFWATCLVGLLAGACLLNLDLQGWPGCLAVALTPTMAFLGYGAFCLSQNGTSENPTCYTLGPDGNPVPVWTIRGPFTDRLHEEDARRELSEFLRQTATDADAAFGEENEE